MTHAPLFAGINGFGVAADWMGWEQPFHCEIDQFCQRIIQYYWPNSIPYYDIRETDFTIWRGKIDVLTGGFPCQPFSMAGKRQGTEDDRHLWPEKLRAVREIAPGYIVGENVYGLVNWSGGLVFDQVQADLEAEGYEVLPVILPACGKDAPHRRDRIWFVAYSNNIRTQEINQGFRGEHKLFNQTPADINGSFITQLDPGRRSVGKVRGRYGVSEKLDGITVSKHFKESIKAYGNAVYPPIALEIFKAIELHNNLITKNK